MDDALDHLYSLPPERFTEERDALVRSLRATDKEAAAAVKALRRPTATAWALNQVARRSPGDLAALFEADEALARAQREGAGREALAEATQARREAIRRLVAAASSLLAEGGHPDSQANRDRIAQTLAAVAVDEGGREALAQGRLTSDLTPGSLWETGAASPFSAGAGGPSEEEADASRLQELRQRADELAGEARRLQAEASQLDADASKAEAAARIARSVANEARRKAEEAAERARKAEG